MKNKMFKSASVLLVAVLMSTCVTSSTFAKYTTSASGSDSARVAKWGVSIVANGDMFSDTYAPLNSDAFEWSVDASNNDNVIAPGTSGNLVAMTISGKPEVAVKVEYDVDLVLNGWSTTNGEVYCPLVIKVGDTSYTRGANQSMEKFEQIVENAIREYSSEYAPNTDLSTVANMPAVSWEWPFEGNNAFDTELGNKASAGSAPTISLSLTTTVSQID